MTRFFTEAAPSAETPEAASPSPPSVWLRFLGWVRTATAAPWAFRLGLVLVLLLAAGHLAYLYRATEGWVVDDAFIAFRYAENWAAGKGLVFNPGDRVEGYTCFLWVALLAFFRVLGADVVATAQVAGIGLTLASVALLYFIGIRKVGPRFGALPALLFALNHSLMTWSFGGLEVPLYIALLLLGSYLLFVAPTPWFLVAFTGAALTRPDGHLFVLFGTAFLFVLFRDRPRRTIFLVLFAAFVPLFAFESFRLAYYGVPLPNTFYVKVGFAATQLQRGVDYLLGAATTYCIFLPACLFLWLRRPSIGAFRAFLLVFGLGYAAFIIYSGGDPLPGYRFALPLLVLAWLALATLLADWGAQRRGSALALVVVFVGNNLFQELRNGPIYQHFANDKVGTCGEHIGRWFQENAPPGALIATNTGGSIPYFARSQRALDMLGLTDAHIARMPNAVGKGYVGHEKYDPAYVLSKKPNYIVLCFSCNTSGPCMGGDKDLVKLPDFVNFYTKRKASHGGFKFSFYQRNEPMAER